VLPPLLLLVDELVLLLVVLLLLVDELLELELPGVQSWMQLPVVAFALAAQQLKPVGQSEADRHVVAFGGKPVDVLRSKQP
jgi:hypothetical protein